MNDTRLPPMFHRYMHRIGFLFTTLCWTSRVWGQEGVPPKVPPLQLDAEASGYKPGTGLQLYSQDGSFMMAPRLRVQFRYTLSSSEGEPTEQRFELRRARLQFKGHVFGEHNEFKAEFALSPADVGQRDTGSPSTSPLLDWYFDFTHLRDLTLRVGQYKIPHNRQRVVSSGDLQLVDRSIVNSEFTLDRDIGVELRSEDFLGLGMLRYYAGVYGGEGRNTRDAHDLGVLLLGRIELLPFGFFKDYKEADLEGSPRPRLSLGVGAARLDNARGNRGVLGSPPVDGGTTDVHSFTWDAVFKMSGFSAITEWILRDASRNPGDATSLDEATGMEVPVPVELPRNGLGGMLQMGYIFPNTSFEVAGRVGFIRRRGNSSLSERDELGAGVSYYFDKHPFKLQADYFQLGTEAGDDRIVTHEARVQLQGAY